jgi:hypothetical protein
MDSTEQREGVDREWLGALECTGAGAMTQWNALTMMGESMDGYLFSKLKTSSGTPVL